MRVFAGVWTAGGVNQGRQKENQGRRDQKNALTNKREKKKAVKKKKKRGGTNKVLWKTKRGNRKPNGGPAFVNVVITRT